MSVSKSPRRIARGRKPQGRKGMGVENREGIHRNGCFGLFYHLFSALPPWEQSLLAALRCLFKSHQFKRVTRGCI